MDNKGTALIVTLVYLIIAAILCVCVLAFSVGQYKLITQRFDKTKNLYLAEGGLYAGLYGQRGGITIQNDQGSQTVTISEPVAGQIRSERTYVPW